MNPAQAQRGSRQVERSLGRIQNRADSLRASLLRTFALFGGAAIGFGAVRTLANFEQALASVGAVSGATGAELGALRAVAEELGATTRFTATQAAEGLLFLSRAGFEVEESIATVDDTLRLAQVGMLDLGRAADIATNVLAGFNLPVAEAGRFVDVLAKTASSANTDVQQLGDAFKLVAPVAAGVGVTLEETAAAIGSLSNAGLQATLAGTGLRRVIAELESPTDKSRTVLAELGLVADDVRVSSVGLQGAFEALNRGGLTAAQALEIFGQRGGPAAIVLSNATDETQELTAALEDAEGFALRTAEAMDDNLLGSLLKVRSAFEAVILAVGREGATGGLRGLLDGLAGVLRNVAENADTLIAFARNLAIVFGPRILLGAVRALTAAIAANPIGLLAVGIAAAVTAVPELQEVLNDLVSTIFEVGSAITSSIDFAGAFEAVAGFVDGAVALFIGFGNAAGAIFDALGEQPKEVGELFKKGFRDAFEATLDFFFAFAQTVGDIIIGLGDDVISLARNVGGAIGAVTSGNLAAAETFADNLESTVLRAGNRVATFTGTLRGNLRGLREVEFLPEVEISNEARDLGNRVSDEFRRGLEDAPQTAQDALSGLLGAGTNDVASAAGALGAGAGGAAPAGDPGVPFATLPGVFDETTEAVSRTRNEMRKVRLETIETLDESSNLADGFTRAFERIALEAEDLASVAEAAVNSFADNATDALVDFAQTGEANIRQFAEAFLDDLTRILARLLVVQAISAVTGGLGITAVPGLQSGGTLLPNTPTLVGEAGPELVTSRQPMHVTSNDGLAALATPPEVNVTVQPPTVVNVQSEDDVAAAIASGEADDAIVNVLARRRDAVRQVVG